jgi:hypothetical protein
MHPKHMVVLAALGSLFISVCSGIAAETRPGKSPPAASEHPTVAAAGGIPDACAFIPRAELESLIGRELREGRRRDMPPGFSQGDFSSPPQLSATRRFHDPPLPEAAGFSSVTITTHPTTAKTFAESRDALKENATNVPGIGDAAYMHGPALIYVRVGNRGFSIRLHVNEPKTEAGKSQLRAVMLSLAHAGVAKL